MSIVALVGNPREGSRTLDAAVTAAHTLSRRLAHSDDHALVPSRGSGPAWGDGPVWGDGPGRRLALI
ncbi:hypothetical protein, partial [Nonomuraea antri]|uniref:hypothetical protein n=1 Tax=Nonomuraea antri TaxID=2730852 RepID=UPI0038B299E1